MNPPSVMRSPRTDPWRKVKRLYLDLRGYLEAVAVAFLVTTFLATTIGVAGGSMEPSLYGGNGERFDSFWHGDRLLIVKYDTWLRRMGVLGAYRRGDVIAFREPTNSPMYRGRPVYYIKRIIGVPGDHLRIVRGQVYLNGRALESSFIREAGVSNFPQVVVENGEIIGFTGSVTQGSVNDKAVRLFYGSTLTALAPLSEGVLEASRSGALHYVAELIVPEDHYFVMGDNRSNSIDSRAFGTIPVASVSGKATAVVWPPQRDGQKNWRTLTTPAAFSLYDSLDLLTVYE